jgi:hypothetical protein
MKKMHIEITRIPGPGSAARRMVRAAALASSLIAANAMAQSAGGASLSDGFYVGAGIAGVHGRAQATGSLDEREAENSAALRLAVGYSLPLAHGLSIAGEIYDLPTHVNLGLGDKADNVFGAAVLPAYALDADLKVFLSVGFERAHTNSPVDDWRNFNSSTPVYGAGASYSFARIGTPLSITARFEQAQYEKITYLEQTDSLRQSRFVLSGEFHF